LRIGEDFLIRNDITSGITTQQKLSILTFWAKNSLPFLEASDYYQLIAKMINFLNQDEFVNQDDRQLKMVYLEYFKADDPKRGITVLQRISLLNFWGHNCLLFFEEGALDGYYLVHKMHNFMNRDEFLNPRIDD
jgi:hypothetical protein